MRQAIYSRFWAPLFGLSVFILVPVVLFGQRAGNSNFTGTVYDNYTRKALQGVNIQVLNVDSGQAMFSVFTNSDGLYSMPLSLRNNIRIKAILNGYTSKEVNYSPAQLKGFDRTIPPIYLDTPIKITPIAPVLQTREQFMSQKLIEIDVLPSPTAYRLLYYLNPELENKGSLMSNEKIVLPIMPTASKEVKSGNRKPFEKAKDTDKPGRRALSDSLENLYRLLSENFDNNRVNYNGVNADNVKKMRTYLQMDLNKIREKIKSLIKLQSDEMLVLISGLSIQFRTILKTVRFTEDDYRQIKAIWLDLSYMLRGNSSYRNFIVQTNDPDMRDFGRIVNIKEETSGRGPASHSADDNSLLPENNYIYFEPTEILNETDFSDDKLAAFGFVIWAKNITKYNDLNIPELQERYIVKYFKPSKIKDLSSYMTSEPRANVAIANLGNAKYGVQVYDQIEKKYLDLVDPFFNTSERFTNRRYDNIFIKDFKDLVMVVIELR